MTKEAKIADLAIFLSLVDMPVYAWGSSLFKLTKEPKSGNIKQIMTAKGFNIRKIK